jgi:hypothetical protein
MRQTALAGSGLVLILGTSLLCKTIARKVVAGVVQVCNQCLKLLSFEDKF